MDERILHELDQKVTGQQATLQSAGVPGFFVTDKQEVSEGENSMLHYYAMCFDR